MNESRLLLNGCIWMFLSILLPMHLVITSHFNTFLVWVISFFLRFSPTGIEIGWFFENPGIFLFPLLFATLMITITLVVSLYAAYGIKHDKEINILFLKVIIRVLILSLIIYVIIFLVTTAMIPGPGFLTSIVGIIYINKAIKS
jgi:hypothetical protein